jgi:hypothetical protein
MGTSVHHDMFVFDADYPSGASVQQPQSPPTVQTPGDVYSQSPKDMSSDQLALWLRNHPSLRETDCEEDIQKLRGTCTCTLPDTVLIVTTT